MISLFFLPEMTAYPIDGYWTTGIRRLLRLELMMKGEIDGRSKLNPGSTRRLADIDLLLCGRPVRKELTTLPEPDAVLQSELDDLMQRMNPNYSITVLDLTPAEEPVYAERRAEIGYQPGSVGKLAVLTALFTALEKVYPNSFEKQKQLLKNKYVLAGRFGVYDDHTVPFFDTITYEFKKRKVVESDVFSLYEWADHMTSVSNNGAASIVWREAMLMRTFGEDYPSLTQEQVDLFFEEIPRDSLGRVANRVVNDPLRDLGITHDEWRLGSMFTRGASGIVSPMGGSIGTPKGLMKWMLALERGDIVSYESSLEMKRLIYMSDRRVRYAKAEVLDSAAVCFKSGSLYSFLDGTLRKKYAGTRYNYMNSVAIVEHKDGSSYLVAMESNVKGKNSAYDHYILATRIDGMLRKYRKKEEIQAVLKGEVD